MQVTDEELLLMPVISNAGRSFDPNIAPNRFRFGMTALGLLRFRKEDDPACFTTLLSNTSFFF